MLDAQRDELRPGHARATATGPDVQAQHHAQRAETRRRHDARHRKLTAALAWVTLGLMLPGAGLVVAGHYADAPAVQMAGVALVFLAAVAGTLWKWMIRAHVVDRGETTD